MTTFKNTSLSDDFLNVITKWPRLKSRHKVTCFFYYGVIDPAEAQTPFFQHSHAWLLAVVCVNLARVKRASAGAAAKKKFFVFFENPKGTRCSRFGGIDYINPTDSYFWSDRF